ncbi:MAG: HAD family phosphatase [Clostridia bacterium]|nr:HAD family phosphatase [Clostridia bacterium]
MPEGAIFDADGTLLDSMGVWVSLGSDYLRRLGYDPPPDLDDRLRLMSLPQGVKTCRALLHMRESEEEILGGILGVITDFYRNRVLLKPGAEEFLRDLAGKGVKLAVATASDPRLIRDAFQRLGILPLFRTVLTCTELSVGKDSPLLYEEALRLLGTSRRATPVFEDSILALLTAQKAGFPTVAVFDPHEEHQERLRDCADCYLADFRDPAPFLRFAESLRG